MQLTIKEIRERAISTKPCDRRGCFLIDPPLAIRNIDLSGTSPPIKRGEIVHADFFDENGDYPNTVHLKEKKGLWWHINHFEIV